jgi:hypothetical protein
VEGLGRQGKQSSESAQLDGPCVVLTRLIAGSHCILGSVLLACSSNVSTSGLLLSPISRTQACGLGCTAGVVALFEQIFGIVMPLFLLTCRRAADDRLFRRDHPQSEALVLPN